MVVKSPLWARITVLRLHSASYQPARQSERAGDPTSEQGDEAFDFGLYGVAAVSLLVMAQITSDRIWRRGYCTGDCSNVTRWGRADLRFFGQPGLSAGPGATFWFGYGADPRTFVLVLWW